METQTWNPNTHIIYFFWVCIVTSWRCSKLLYFSAFSFFPPKSMITCYPPSLKSSNQIQCVFVLSVALRFLRFTLSFFFLNITHFAEKRGKRYCSGYCLLNSNRKCWLSVVNSAHVHCSRTHKFHFLSIFSLKMGPTALFTHLKIILLQYFQFSVFSFNKISSIQTHPK